MPLYPATLQHVPRPMDEARVLACGLQLKATLDAVHREGYGHNDIKVGNLCIFVSLGMCILGDFGSAQKLDHLSKEMTETHWPAELDSKPGSEVVRTSAAVDMFQLAVTLLERAGVYSLVKFPKPIAIREAAVSEDLRSFVLQLQEDEAAVT